MFLKNYIFANTKIFKANATIFYFILGVFIPLLFLWNKEVVILRNGSIVWSSSHHVWTWAVQNSC